MRMFAFALLSVLFFTPTAKGQEQKFFTQMWCDEGLTGYLQAVVWPPGLYEFEIIADGDVTQCRGEMPLKSCEQSVICDRETVRIGVYGCNKDQDLHAFSTLSLFRIPETLTLKIKQQQGWTASSTIRIENKQCGYPNGEQCDDRICCSASASIPVEWDYPKDGAGE